jgi:hypothetical protein
MLRLLDGSIPEDEDGLTAPSAAVVGFGLCRPDHTMHP